MEKDSSGSTGSGAVNREGVLEKMLAEEVAKRHDAERAAEGLRRRMQLLEAEVLDLRQASDWKKGSVLCTAAGDDGTAVSTVGDEECADSSDSALKIENHRLREFVKRQNALIDVLRRQKVLLEASAAVNISVRDFDKQLEIHKV
ncbi:conserved hypothetical protein [Leishmania infantum JPCM5]|uniref:Uncharacterized protein n=2 Tax=Leishmania infantum TaxID=5671 RepID=A4HTR7_LEIIN|nr:conserved hypothetical protein [Leishmania infantum JPCM5]CAC9452830.1 hypothetical_protein_-__conserved [Leishmania infantum]CAM65823.1 conserved hypothetical protein [Leishmania infantum JPCM5]SUZ39445.1 hypothetical_protein_-__conserved [Leishmania infantum]|eukprot:XP_001463458.1 conserved hypothetical protein [Leishmania infantum JPCM5]